MIRSPSLSVIITNHNYSNYLAAAIESALNQTRPALEVIVVDDGSTDGSAGILATYRDRVTVISKAGGGQASAFNAGFAAAKGDLIYFLDADDAAGPALVETVTALWYESLAAVCFAIELLDAEGRHMGVYDALPADIDNRPGFVSSAGFTFLPTSANVFARAALERLMPMDEPRWRISADAVLLRAATVAGRVMPLRRTLAAYRIHAYNNYYVRGASDLWRERRDMRDVTDLADTFADSPRYFGLEGGLSADERRTRNRNALSLMTAGVRFRTYRADVFDPHHGTGAALRRLARRLLHAELPWHKRLALSATAAIASWPAQHSARWRTWIGEPGARPAILDGLLRLAGHDAYARFKAPVRRARWRTPQKVGQICDFTTSVDGFPMLQEGWRVRPQPGDIYMVGKRATLSLWMNPSSAAYKVQLALSPMFGPDETTRNLSVSLNGEVLIRATIDRPMTVDIPLQAGSVAAGGEILLELRLKPDPHAGIRSRLAGGLGPRPTIALRSVSVEPASAMPRSAYAEDGATRPFTDFLDSAEGGGFIALASGGGLLREPSGAALFSVLGPHTPVGLTLELPTGQPAGLMRITCEGEDLFQGQWGGTDRLQLDVPTLDASGYALLRLRFDFSADDLSDTRRPVIAAVRFHRQRGSAGALRVNPGQHLQFEEHLPSRGALGKGWHFDEDGIAVASDGIADILLRLPSDAGIFSASFHVAPILEPLEGLRHVLAISCHGLPLAQVTLEGPAEIDVPLDRLPRAPDPITLLTVHSLLVAEDGLPPRPGPLRLECVTFSKGEPKEAASQAFAPVAGTASRAGDLEAKLRAADGFLTAMAGKASGGGFDDTTVGTLLDHRAAVKMAIGRLGGRALASALVAPETLLRIARLAAAIEDAVPLGLEYGSCIDRWPDDPEGALRQALLALVDAPVWMSPAFADLERLPQPLLWHVPVVADLLTRSPLLLPAPRQRENYTTFAEHLVLSADAALGRDLPGSARHALAAAVIDQIRPRHVLFGNGTALPLLASLGRAMERLLHQEGYALAWLPPADRTGERLRVGIILRGWGDEPEARIAKGLFTPADPRLLPIRILLNPSPLASDEDGFAETINLSGLDLGEAVEHLRAARLDVLVLGAYFIGLDRLAAIVAHRLAPVQLATAAISPTSTGLSSFDGMITSEDLDPAGLPPAYLEPVHRLAGPIQRFAEVRVRDAADRSRLQSRLLAGLPPDAILYVSGAMAQKIGTDLLDAFARILKEVPEAVLALFPFAANWRTTFAPAAFRRTVDSALAARGVPRERVFVLPTMNGEEVSNLLAAADVYLDSFPYAGATTVVEALEQRCPVVALDGETQRGRQGAVWLRHAGLAANVAQTVDAYVDRAVALGWDAAARTQARARIDTYLGDKSAHRGDAAFASQFADHLMEEAEQRGIHLDPPRNETAETTPARFRKPLHPPRYVYHHMPKTAGTAAMTVFRARFKLRHDYRDKWSPVHGRAPFDLDELTQDDLLCGHFELPESRIENRYPALLSGPGWRLFTFVREPLDLALSNYFFERDRRRDDPDFVDVGLSAHLRGSKDNYLEHFDHQDGDWRGRLDRYWFIGTLERLHECLAYLAETWECILPTIAVENSTARPETPAPEDVEIFLRNHATAYAIYNEARHRLDKTLRR